MRVIGITILLALLLLSVSPVSAQSCDTTEISFSEEWNSPSVGISDGNGYTFEWLGGAGSPVSVDVYDTDGVNFVATLDAGSPGPITITNAGYVYMTSSSGSDPATIEFCEPVPTPTPEPTPDVAALVSEIAETQKASFAWLVFVTLSLLGVTILAYLRTRM